MKQIDPIAVRKTALLALECANDPQMHDNGKFAEIAGQLYALFGAKLTYDENTTTWWLSKETAK